MGHISSPATDTMSPAVRDKGQAIFDGRLVAGGPDDRTYRVKGTHGVYAVRLTHVDESGAYGECSCPARRACSHLYAAILLAAERGDLDAYLADAGHELSSDPFDLR